MGTRTLVIFSVERADGTRVVGVAYVEQPRRPTTDAPVIDVEPVLERAARVLAKAA